MTTIPQNTSIENSALETLGVLTIAEAFKPNGGDTLYSRVEAEVLSKEYDVSTKAGREEIASVAYKIARTKTTFDKFGKEYVTALKELPKQVDAERARMRDKFEALQSQVRKPLDEFEAKEAARIAWHEGTIALLESIASGLDGLSIQDIQAKIQHLESIDMGVDFEEFAGRIKKAHTNTSNALQVALANAIESERLEAERVRVEAEKAALVQAEREARIAQEAAERATREAEAKAHAERQQMVERAETEKREAQAKAKAEQDAIVAKAETERQQMIQVQREVDAKAQAERDECARREADEKHRASVHIDMLKSLIALNLSQEDALRIVIALSGGNVPHVKVVY